MLKHLKSNLTMGRTTRQTQFEAEYVWVNAWTGTRTREKRPRTSTSSPEWLQSPLHLCRSSTFSSSDTSTKYFMGRSDVQTEPHRVRVFLKGFCLRNGTHARIGGRWLVFQSVYQHLGAFLPFSGVAEICSHSQKWQSSTWSSCSTFTWKALSSSWCTTSKTALALTMSSTPSTPSTLSLISSLWFVFERRSIPF